MRIAFRSFIVACLCAVGLFAATPSSAALVTGFESPDYTAGSLTGQQGWVNGGGNDASVLIGGSGGLPAAPEDDQYFGLTRGAADSRASYQFAAVAPTDLINVDVLLAFTGTTAASQYPLVYVTNGGTTSATRGVIFGFQSKAGTNAADIVYRNGTDFTVIASAAADTFYRFSAVIDPTTATYDIEVRNLDDSLIASIQDAAARQPIDVFTHIGLATNTGGTLYVDQLSVSIVPEPGSIVLVGSAVGMAGVVLRRRQSKRQG